MKIAKVFYGCNMPFNIADNPLWKDMIQSLHPGYDSPNRRTLSGTLLDEVFNGVQKHIRDDIKRSEVTLMQDGWSDIHNSPVIATAIHTGEKSHFVSSVETGSNVKDAAYCTKLALDAVQEVEQKYGTKVIAMVTDNENKMKAMRRKLETEKPEMLTYGCASHYLNLLGQDMSVSAIVSQVIEVQKYFRNHHKPNALLSAFPSSVKPQLPCATRWNSQVTCLKSFLRNRPFMMQVCGEDSNQVEQRIANLVDNRGLYVQVKDQVAILDPIAAALDRSQADDCNIAEVCQLWLKLLKDSQQSNDLTTSLKKKVANRFQDCITPIHLLANILHPRYLGAELNQKQEEEAEIFLRSKFPEMVPTLYAFMAKTVPFTNALFSEENLRMDVKIWWSTQNRKAKDGTVGTIHQLAERLNLMPASSAAIERVFSTYSLVQTKVRNRLGLDKAAKLVSCYRNLRSKDIDTDDCVV